jgi:predicted Na+-dependent transporter
MMSFLEIVGNFLLFALVFGMSATVDINCMRHQIRNKSAILLGIFCQFILLPFLGFAAVNVFNLDASIGITLLVVTSSPGGSYSNWYDIQYRAELHSCHTQVDSAVHRGLVLPLLSL